MKKKYKPIDTASSPRFVGIRTFNRLPEKRTLEDVDFIITGVPFDTGASYRTGQRFAPETIRSVSVLMREYNYDLGLNIFEYCSGVDYGDIDVIPGDIITTYNNMVRDLKPVYEKGVIPIVMGGDHSISLGELRAIKQEIGPVALLHFDSHCDMDDDYYSGLIQYNHGTSFKKALDEGCILVEKSIQVGMRGTCSSAEDFDYSKRLGFQVLTSDEIHRKGIEYAIESIQERVGDTPVFVSFDIDFIDPAYAPGTGTPEIGGFSTWQTKEIIRKGMQGLNFVGFDLVEVLPHEDSGKITSWAAANIMHEFMSLIAFNKKNGKYPK